MNLGIPGYPDRHDMVKTAIFMERSRYNWNEWRIINRLADSPQPIRKCILAFAEECLDMYNGLVPCKAHSCYEIALVAARNTIKMVLKQTGHIPEQRLAELQEPPAPWTQEQKEEAWVRYHQNHPDEVRVTAKLKESLKREAAVIHHEPYTTPSGCTIIPFSAGAQKAQVQG